MNRADSLDDLVEIDRKKVEMAGETPILMPVLEARVRPSKGTQEISLILARSDVSSDTLTVAVEAFDQRGQRCRSCGDASAEIQKIREALDLELPDESGRQ